MLKLRPATRADWARLFAWRNDEATRRASKSTDAVPLEAHLRWLRETLEKPGVRLYVATDDAVARTVGTGRLDRRTPTVVEVSLTVAPEARGRGYASAIVAQLTGRALAEFGPGVRTVKAEVREDNPGSLRAFAACGYAVRKVKDGLAELVLEGGETT